MLMVLTLTACIPLEDAPVPTPSVNPVIATLLQAKTAGVATGTPAMNAGRTQTISPAATQPVAFQQRSRYTLKVTFDYSANRLQVVEEVAFINRVTQPLDEVLLVVEANRIQGVFNLKVLTWSDGSKIKGYLLEGARLRIPLLKPLTPAGVVNLHLEYELKPSNQPGPLSNSGRQINLVDWYPYAPPYHSGQGWLAYEPAGVGEHLVYDTADFDVSIRLLNPPENLKLAASTLAETIEGGYRYHAQDVRNFSWSASTDYVVREEVHGKTRVQAYVFPEDADIVDVVMQTMLKALDVYEQLYSPYPRPVLVMVEAGFFDGLETDGLFFLGQQYFVSYDGTPESYLVALSAHEVAHQWWFALVGNDQAMEPWLDEALCTYSEALFYEHAYPEETAWWWQFRVNRFEPKGRVGSSIYDFFGFRAYVNATYLRGAEFLQVVRVRMGDKAFFEFLQDYIHRYQDNLASADGFFATLLVHSKTGFEDLQAEYFR